MWDVRSVGQAYHPAGRCCEPSVHHIDRAWHEQSCLLHWLAKGQYAVRAYSTDSNTDKSRWSWCLFTHNTIKYNTLQACFLSTLKDLKMRASAITKDSSTCERFLKGKVGVCLPYPKPVKHQNLQESKAKKKLSAEVSKMHQKKDFIYHFMSLDKE